MTKRELEARVAELEVVVGDWMGECEGLRARLALLDPDGAALKHLGRLERAAAPFERRLAELPELEAAVMRWDVVAGSRALSEEEAGQFKHAVARLSATRLDARDASALNQIYRQLAEVIGVLRSRRGAGASKAAPPRVSEEVGLERVGNIVKFLKEQG